MNVVIVRRRHVVSTDMAHAGPTCSCGSPFARSRKIPAMQLFCKIPHHLSFRSSSFSLSPKSSPLPNYSLSARPSPSSPHHATPSTCAGHVDSTPSLSMSSPSPSWHGGAGFCRVDGHANNTKSISSKYTSRSA
jgi:hypothetical protein